jgi:hypothetical protein
MRLDVARLVDTVASAPTSADVQSNAQSVATESENAS